MDQLRVPYLPYLSEASLKGKKKKISIYESCTFHACMIRVFTTCTPFFFLFIFYRSIKSKEKEKEKEKNKKKTIRCDAVRGYEVPYLTYLKIQNMSCR